MSKRSPFYLKGDNDNKNIDVTRSKYAFYLNVLVLSACNPVVIAMVYLKYDIFTVSMTNG